MATTTTLTVDSAPRDYSPKWHEAYAKDSFRNDTSIEVCPLSDGDSVIRRQHQLIQRGAIEKHFESVEDIFVDAEGNNHRVKFNLTMTFEVGNVGHRDRLLNLADGFVSTGLTRARLAEILDGGLNR